MKKTAAMALITVLGVAATGCEVEEQEPEIPPAAEQDRIPDAEEVTPAPGNGQAGLRVDSLNGDPYLTDGEGRAVYAIEMEPEGESTCYDRCALEWPPFLASGGEPSAGAGPIRSELLGTLERRDGEVQVTYDGRPLYYYHDDQGPGQTEGHHVTDRWGEWYLVRPDGDLLEGHENGEGGGAAAGA